MRNLLTVFILACGIITFTAFGAFRTFSANCEEVPGEVLRLHIPANSDSDEDQGVKLALRDALLERFGGELSECGDLKSASALAEEKIPEIERFANEFLSERGFSYGARAEVVEMYFTTREYERLILPAGQYTALRVTLGSGEGHNWWCVIFPQLCLPAAVDYGDYEQENAEQVLETFGKPQKVTAKFALYEWLLGARG